MKKSKTGVSKTWGYSCELDFLLSQAPIEYRSPDLKQAMGSLRRPAHLPSLVHSCIDGAPMRVWEWKPDGRDARLASRADFPCLSLLL